MGALLIIRTSQKAQIMEYKLATIQETSTTVVPDHRNMGSSHSRLDNGSVSTFVLN